MKLEQRVSALFSSVKYTYRLGVRIFTVMVNCFFFTWVFACEMSVKFQKVSSILS